MINIITEANLVFNHRDLLTTRVKHDTVYDYIVHRVVVIITVEVDILDSRQKSRSK